jgi:hypothetical protein
MITVFHAIQSLVPGAEISVGMYDHAIIWHKPEIAPVTTAQILEEQRRLQQAYDWNMYQQNRAREYPSIQEQLDALYHAGVFPAAMAAKIRAVKEKYPRHPMSHSPTAEPQLVENPVAKMTVDQWLAEETKITDQEWLARQQSAGSMTREQWLASQQDIKTIHSPTLLRDTSPTITAEEWLAQQTAQTNGPTMTREQWLEQQKTALQPRQMTREQWLAEQANIK